MQKFEEHQIVSQLKCVFHAAGKMLDAFPGPTGLNEIENLRYEVEQLRGMLYCPICGVDQLAFPDHIEACPKCNGLLHWTLDAARCENCDYVLVERIEPALLESDSE